MIMYVQPQLLREMHTAWLDGLQHVCAWLHTILHTQIRNPLMLCLLQMQLSILTASKTL